ncbi:MAG: type II toxin-antitoxin system VapC family toxin [Candidatus Asgardarchaeia archaeon]
MHKYAVVLDTTYILPLFNVETKKFGKKSLLELLTFQNVDLIIPTQLIIEAKWVIIGLIKQRKITDKEKALRDFSDGLLQIKYGNKFLLTDIIDVHIDQAESKLFLSENIRNYFDRVLLASAIELGDILLTEDLELLNLRDLNKRYNDLLILNWNELKEYFKNL